MNSNDAQRNSNCYLKSISISVLCTLVFLLIIKIFFPELFNFDKNNTIKFVLIISSIFFFVTSLLSPLPYIKEIKELNTRINNKKKKRINNSISQVPAQSKLAQKTKSSLAVNPSKNLNNNAVNTDNIKNENTSSTESSSQEDEVTLYFGNIPFKLNERNIYSLLNKYDSNVHSAHITRDHKTKKRKGIAFVKISKEGAEQAIAELNGSELYGRTIVVKIANERKKV